MLLLLTLAGCRSRPTGEVIVDLGAGLPFADVRAEVETVDLGMPDSRWHLGSGWSSESWYQRQGRMMVVAGEVESTLELRLEEPADLTIGLFGRGFGDWDPGAGRLEVLVNDHLLGRLPVQRDLGWHEVEASAGQVVAGANRLTLRWPGVAGGGQPPTLGWLDLRVTRRTAGDGGDPGRASRRASTVSRSSVPRYRADQKALFIPAYVRLDYYLRVPEHAELTIDRVATASGRGGTLAVELAVDGRDGQETESAPLALVPSGEDGVRLDLAAWAGRVVRLSLEAVGKSPQAAFSGLVLDAPVIRGPIAEPVIRDPVVRDQGEAREGEPSQGGTDSGFARARRPNVLIYVVDTLRRDHLGVYGYPRPVSPVLDRFAADATVFDNAIGQSSWTRASMASVFTGLWPGSHATNGRKDVLAPEAVTLAELLAERGYQTMSIVLNHNVFPVFGFWQGIDQFTKMSRGNADDATEAFLGWLDWRAERMETAPFFAWIHPVNPHDPYVPPPDLRERFDDLDGQRPDLSRPPEREEWSGWDAERRRRTVRHLVNLYDAEIASNDRAFGALLDGLAERALLDDTVLIFLSDHGEEFQEHGGWTHGHNLNVETLDIPLIVRFPDRGRGERVADVAQHIDVAPTVLDYLGLPVPAIMEGRSLLGLLSDGASLGGDPVPAFGFVDLEGRPHLSVVEGDWKLIRRLEAARGILTVLYHRREDPAETVNRLLEHPIRGRYLEKLLEARQRGGSLLTTSEAELDEETEQALRALGYLQ